MAISGCNKGASNGVVGSGIDSESSTSAPKVVTEFDFANRCYAVKSLANQKFLLATSTCYEAAAMDSSHGTPFSMKPAALGTYIFYDQDGRYLTVANNCVARNTNLEKSVQWSLVNKGDGSFGIKSVTSGLYLTVSGKKLALSKELGQAGRFAFVGRQGCQAFPEAEVGVDLLDAGGKQVNPRMAMARPQPGEPIIGWADQHSHIQTHLGMGGLYVINEPFDPLGITKALADCSAAHGPNGMLSIVDAVYSRVFSHATDGWPTFSFWPSSNSITHQQMYYKWLERSWLGGQRLLLDYAVNLQAAALAGKMISPANNLPSNDMQVAEQQILNDYAMQDYIDAQCGGPGQGWFRICKTAADARQVISQGKMAVILGMEVDTIFDAPRDYITDYEQGRISKAELDAKLDTIREQLDKFHNLGVRSIFPIHGLNNGFGGTGFLDVTNILNFVMRGTFLEPYETDNPRITFRPAAIPADAFTIDLLHAVGIQLPLVPWGSKGIVNKRGLSKLGQWFIKELIARGIVIDLDHMGERTKSGVLDMLWEAKYPGLTCSHGAVEDVHPQGTSEDCITSIPQMIKILQLGGIMAQFPNVMRKDALLSGLSNTASGAEVVAQGTCYLDYLAFMKQISAAKKPGWAILDKPEYFHFGGPYKVPTSWYDTNDDPSDDLVLGLALGTDANVLSLGLASKGADNVPLNYDDGSFDALREGLYSSNVKTVRFHRQVAGRRAFDFNTDGAAQYGMLPDFIRHNQIQKNPVDQESLFHGAEAYIRMLERVDRYVANPGIYPDRDPKYWITVDTEYWHDTMLQ